MENLGDYFWPIVFACITLGFGWILLKKIKKWYQKKLQLWKIDERRKKLYKYKQEVLFHINWAEERGEVIDDFKNDLQEINDEIQALDLSHEQRELINVDTI